MPLGTIPLGTEEFNQFGPLFVYWPVTWWEAVRLFLAGDARLVDLGEGSEAGARVYLRRAPSRAAYPLLIITPIRSMPAVDSTSDYWESWDVQFTVIARDDIANEVYGDVQAETVGRLAYQVLAPKARQDDGTVGPRLKIAALDGYEMGAVPGWTMLREQASRTAGNVNAWSFDFGYTLLVGRSMVRPIEADLATP